LKLVTIPEYAKTRHLRPQLLRELVHFLDIQPEHEVRGMRAFAPVQLDQLLEGIAQVWRQYREAQAKAANVTRRTT